MSGKLATSDIRAVGLNAKNKVDLDEDTIQALMSLRRRFTDNRPRVLSLDARGKPVIVYTDGSFEVQDGKELARIGGVLIKEGSDVRVFGCHVPEALLQFWHDYGKEHLIGQVELFAVVIARILWKELLHNRGVILFIDNWAVLDAYIPGNSREKTWRQLLLKLEEIDSVLPAHVWASRVPSESNVADPPSRGSLNGLQFLGPLDVDKARCPFSGEEMSSVV